MNYVKKKKGLIRLDTNYTTTGRKDTVYIAMDSGKRESKQKRDLFCILCDF